MVLSVEESAAEKLVSVLPRVLIVSRRTVRKNKFVDFVGEYHLDLIVQYGAVPVIVPRVTGVHTLLDSFEPIHGVLLCEGEDIDPSLYDNDLHNLTQEEIEEIKRLHISDTSIDKNKDSIELQLAKRCLERNIPYLGICRGSQVLNVACGGSLFQDVEKELLQKGGLNQVEHINYEDYDGHRHAVEVLKGTPLHEWFKDSFISGEETCQLNVNSYHHQGVKRLAERFREMAYAPDGLIEAFYDPENFDPSNGKFIIGLQFHPERMQHEKDTDISTGIDLDSVFDYPGCPRAYQDFVKAVISYQKRLSLAERGKEVAKLDVPLEKQRRKIVRSFSLAKCLYEEQVHSRKSRTEHNGKHALKALQTPQVFSDENDLEVGAEFLLMSTTSNTQQERRLKQMGATVRNSLLVLDKMQAAKKREAKARALLGKLPTEELHDLLEFYESMAQAASYLLQRRNLTNADI